MHKIGIALVVTLAVLAMMSPAAAQDIKVLIVDGQNNHKWAAMTLFIDGRRLIFGDRRCQVFDFRADRQIILRDGSPVFDELHYVLARL